MSQPLENLTAVRPQKPEHLPTVLTKSEALRVINALTGVHQLMAKILYGSGLRLIECLRLRIKDVDFTNRQIIVRDGKGEHDRSVPLPETVFPALKAQVQQVRAIHNQDLRDGFGEVYLPYALEVKYPSAPREFAWQYLFPASRRSIDPQSGKTMRHHLDETVLQRAIKNAVRFVRLDKPVSAHTFRHSFATHLLQNGYDTQHLRSGQVSAPSRNCSAIKMSKPP